MRSKVSLLLFSVHLVACHGRFESSKSTLAGFGLPASDQSAASAQNQNPPGSAPPTAPLQIRIADAVRDDGDQLVLELQLNRPEPADVVVSVEVMEGTALPGIHYSLPAPTQTIAAGRTSISIEVPILFREFSAREFVLKIVSSSRGTITRGETRLSVPAQAPYVFQNQWSLMATIPPMSYVRAAVWTGKTVILLQNNRTDLYDPKLNRWTAGAPAIGLRLPSYPVSQASIVWTGTEVIAYYGGTGNPGQNYDPLNDQAPYPGCWRPIAQVDTCRVRKIPNLVPGSGYTVGRIFHTTLWSGQKLFSLGGNVSHFSGFIPELPLGNGSVLGGDFGYYQIWDGANDWQSIGTPLSDREDRIGGSLGISSAAFWIGGRLLVISTHQTPNSEGEYSVIRLYDPARPTSRWTRLPSSLPRFVNGRVLSFWTGNSAILIGYSSGAIWR